MAQSHRGQGPEGILVDQSSPEKKANGHWPGKNGRTELCRNKNVDLKD
jgi:hypothetical protein